MTTSLAFRVLLSHFLPGLMALPGGIALTALLLSVFGLHSCSSFTCCSDVCSGTLLQWARDNPVLVSLGALAIPLIFGVLLDDWRHGFWPCREDEDARWCDGIGQLAQLPKHLFRFMYDEYYYYVEFDGNSFLAVGFSGPFVFINYLRVSAWHANGVAVSLLLVPALLCLFFWRSWNKALTGFFEDLEATVQGRSRKPPLEECL